MRVQHQAKKSLGQNFLTDQNIVRNIIRNFDPKPDDVVLEIGPGEGALTGLLLEHGCRVIPVEFDAVLAEHLRTRFNGLEVTTADILQCDITTLAHERNVRKLRVIGNIPYYITSPILFHLLSHRTVVHDAMLMMQYEVAERLTARKGSKQYGILSVAAQTYTIPKLLFKVSPSCFTPRPNVTSAVVQFMFRDTEGIAGFEEAHRSVLRTAFNQRRKMLRNALMPLFGSAEASERIFHRAEIDDTRRAETLTTADFIRLAQAYRFIADESSADNAA